MRENEKAPATDLFATAFDSWSVPACIFEFASCDVGPRQSWRCIASNKAMRSLVGSSARQSLWAYLSGLTASLDEKLCQAWDAGNDTDPIDRDLDDRATTRLSVVPLTGKGRRALLVTVGQAAGGPAEDRIKPGSDRSSDMLRLATELGRVGLWDWDLESGRIEWSDEHFRMEGFEVGEVIPTFEVWISCVHPEDRADAKAKIDHAMSSGTDYVNEFRVVHPDDNVRWMSARGRFLFNDAGKPVRMTGAMIDITDRRREEDWQKLLIAELQHRARDLISVACSIVKMSVPGHRNVRVYADHLIGRLHAVGRIRSSLSRTSERNVDLEELIRSELLVYVAPHERYRLKGPDVVLALREAEIVSLAIHELATNSVKYGALGGTGHVGISWTIDNERGAPWVRLRWQETAQIHGSKRPRAGFGQRLIEERLPHELHGRGRLIVHDTGVLAELEFPRSSTNRPF